jgi:flagella basal body P-ring formation protein FlgA
MGLPALALLAAAAVAAGTAAGPEIESLLLAKLRERYPAVARWEVHPFGRMEAAGAQPVSVTRLGARSAVRVGARVYWYAVAGYQIGLSATRTIRAGESLDPSAVQSKELNAMAAACTPLTDAARLAGVRAKHTMRADQVICEESIEPRPPVARGDDVTVRYIGASISLVTKGVAETDGALGESVHVKKADSTDRYLAVVSGIREVTIK